MEKGKPIQKRRKFHFRPQTEIGNTSFWLVAFGFVVIVFLDVLSGLTQSGGSLPGSGFVILTRIIPSIIAFGCILLGGVCSFVSIIKYRDFSFYVFLSAFIGLVGLLFVLGEFWGVLG